MRGEHHHLGPFASWSAGRRPSKWPIRLWERAKRLLDSQVCLRVGFADLLSVDNGGSRYVPVQGGLQEHQTGCTTRAGSSADVPGAAAVPTVAGATRSAAGR